jgi:hypothetical protein
MEDPAAGKVEKPEGHGPASCARATRGKSCTRYSDDILGTHRILKGLGYSLKAPYKQKEGTAHPDRDDQFRYLNKQVGAFVKAGQPVISVDTKKKELVGEFSNGGAESPDRRAHSDQGP